MMKFYPGVLRCKLPLHCLLFLVSLNHIIIAGTARVTVTKFAWCPEGRATLYIEQSQAGPAHINQ
jgi:hypothetical protein